MFSLRTKTATVSRQSYTTDGSGNKKSSYVSTGNSYIGHLKAQSIERTIDLNMFGKVFKFTTFINADIQDGDRLTIDSTTYDVQGVSEFTGKTFNTKQLLIKKI